MSAAHLEVYEPSNAPGYGAGRAEHRTRPDLWLDSPVRRVTSQEGAALGGEAQGALVDSQRTRGLMFRIDASMAGRRLTQVDQKCALRALPGKWY